MMVRILRRLPYAADHMNVEMLDPGTERDIADDLVPGLEREGYVERTGSERPAAAPEAPETIHHQGAPETKPAIPRRRRPPK